jgi:sulfatase maturation enzyme AslB (radical SAM superfamily)
MCPPYYNIEKYDDSFESLDEYKEFLKSIFDIWHKNNAQIFGIILREDLAELIDELYAESHEMIFETSHLTKNTGKKYKEYFYIFKK